MGEIEHPSGVGARRSGEQTPRCHWSPMFGDFGEVSKISPPEGTLHQPPVKPFGEHI
jgi:hypothetical protein